MRFSSDFRLLFRLIFISNVLPLILADFDAQDGWLDGRYDASDGLHVYNVVFKMMNLVFKMMNFVFKMMNFGRLMECIVAAYGKHSIQAARVAVAKKTDDDDALARITTSTRELGLPTWMLVLGELDTIARMVFPCVFVANTFLKELRLMQEPRVAWNGLIYVSKNEEFCIKNEELCVKTRNCRLKTRNFAFKMMILAGLCLLRGRRVPRRACLCHQDGR